MNANDNIKEKYRKVIDQVVRQLESNGIPSERIVKRKWIKRRGIECFAADVAVMNARQEVESVYEIRLHNVRDPNVISLVRREMRSVIGVCKCYLVTLENNELIIAELMADGSQSDWLKMSDVHPCVERKNDEDGDDGHDLRRRWIVPIGLILVAIFVWGEVLGQEFSWKVYSVLFVTAVLFASSYGYPMKVDVTADGCKLSVGSDAPCETEEG